MGRSRTEADLGRPWAEAWADLGPTLGRLLDKAGLRRRESDVETGQMSAVETGKMSAAETGQMSAVETRQMYSIKTGQRPV